jgi:hypothetical protein
MYGRSDDGPRIMLAQYTGESDENTVFRAAIVQGQRRSLSPTYVVNPVMGATRKEVLDKIVMELELMSERILKKIDATGRPLTYETVDQHDDTQASDDERSSHTSISRGRGRPRPTVKSRAKSSSQHLAIDENYDDDVAESKPESRRVLRSTKKLKDEANSDNEIIMRERPKFSTRMRR